MKFNVENFMHNTNKPSTLEQIGTRETKVPSLCKQSVNWPVIELGNWLGM